MSIDANQLIEKAKETGTPQIVKLQSSSEASEFRNSGFLPSSSTDEFDEGETMTMTVKDIFGGVDSQGKKKAWLECKYRRKVYRVSGQTFTDAQLKKRLNGEEEFGGHMSDLPDFEPGDKIDVVAVPYEINGKSGVYLAIFVE